MIVREQALQCREHHGYRELTVEVLRQIAARKGNDFATALLHDRLVRSPEHGPFIQRVDASAEVGRPPSGALLAIVPGACYREFPQTGADGRRLQEDAHRHGWPVEMVPVASFGSLADNARMIRDWLHGRPKKKIVLVSLSKGGADVRTALAQPDAAETFRNVAAWINLSGIVFGTELANWFLQRRFWRMMVRFLCWRHGYAMSTLEELVRRPGGPLDGDVVLPPGLRAVHMIGFPMQRHLRSQRARRGHRRVAALGPGDGGGIMLGDVGRLPGWIYPVLGADHYLEPDWDIRPALRRILRVCLEG